MNINSTRDQSEPGTLIRASTPDMRWLESLPHRCSLALNPHDTAPRTARNFLSRILPEWSLPEFLDTASLIATELITNSLQGIERASWPAQRTPLRLWLHGGRSVLAVSTWDAIAQPPVPRDAGIDDENGRGLAIVTALSARWGFYFPRDCGGKVVWSIIRTPLLRSTRKGSMKGDDMIAIRCTCGFSELADEEIIDHLQEAFEPADSRGSDGVAHDEGDRLACLCGLVFITTEELDGHFLKVFTPDDAIGRDGKRHEARTGSS